MNELNSFEDFFNEFCQDQERTIETLLEQLVNGTLTSNNLMHLGLNSIVESDLMQLISDQECTIMNYNPESPDLTIINDNLTELVDDQDNQIEDEISMEHNGSGSGSGLKES